MLVPLTQLLRVIKVYFPLALPGPKGINVEFTAQRSEVRSQPPSPDGFGAPRRSEIRRQEIAVRRKGFSCGSGFSVLPVPGAVPGSLPALSLSKGRGQPRSFALNYFYDFYDFYGFYDFNDLPLTRPIVHEMV